MGKKKSGRLNRGPFTAVQIERLLKKEGCVCVTGGSHPLYERPRTGARWGVSRKWTSIKCGDPIFNGLKDFLGCGKKELCQKLDDC